VALKVSVLLLVGHWTQLCRGGEPVVRHLEATSSTQPATRNSQLVTGNRDLSVRKRPDDAYT
jgi:hypothetical protein